MKTQKVIVEITEGKNGTMDMIVRLDPPVPPANQWPSLPDSRKKLLHVANDVANGITQRTKAPKNG